MAGARQPGEPLGCGHGGNPAQTGQDRGSMGAPREVRAAEQQVGWWDVWRQDFGQLTENVGLNY